MWLVGVVVRRYIDFLILLIPTPLLLLYLFFFAAASLLFVHFENVFVLVPVLFCKKFLCIKFFLAQYKHTYGQLRASHDSHMKGCT